MAYASKEGRTRIDSRSPSASGQCDRCGFLYNHSHLRWQMDYSGAGIYNKRILVCERCYDIPQQQLKVIVIPPDPLPVLNARPPDYVNSEANYRATSGQDYIDPVVGIPVFNGNILGAYVNYTGDNEILLEDGSGYLTLENGIGLLSQEDAFNPIPILINEILQEDSPFDIMLEGGKGILMQEAVYQNVLSIRVTQQTGEPPGGLNTRPGSNFQVPGDDDIGLPYDNIEVPKTGPL